MHAFGFVGRIATERPSRRPYDCGHAWQSGALHQITLETVFAHAIKKIDAARKRTIGTILFA